jgi:hypothetical protein
MADSLTSDQKYEYCQHKEALQKQGNKFPLIVALEYCKNKFGVSPSSFGADVEFMFDKKIAAILIKMMIERFRNKAQSILDAFFV